MSDIVERAAREVIAKGLAVDGYDPQSMADAIVMALKDAGFVVLREADVFLYAVDLAPELTSSGDG